MNKFTRTITLLVLCINSPINQAANAAGVDDLTRCSASDEYRDELKKYGASLMVDMDYSCLTDVASMGEAITAYQLIDTRTHNTNASDKITDAWRMPVLELKNKKFLQNKTLLLIGEEFSRVNAAHDCATLKKAGFTAVKLLVGGAGAWAEYKNMPVSVNKTVKMVSAQALIFEYFNGHVPIIATSKYSASTLTNLGISNFQFLEGNDAQRINEWLQRNNGNRYTPVIIVSENASAALKVSYNFSNVYQLDGGVDALRQQLEGNIWINHNRMDTSGGFVCGRK